MGAEKVTVLKKNGEGKKPKKKKMTIPKIDFRKKRKIRRNQKVVR